MEKQKEEQATRRRRGGQKVPTNGPSKNYFEKFHGNSQCFIKNIIYHILHIIYTPSDTQLASFIRIVYDRRSYYAVHFQYVIYTHTHPRNKKDLELTEKVKSYVSQNFIFRRLPRKFIKFLNHLTKSTLIGVKR